MGKYLIVETIEEDEKNYVAVPETWVKENILSYPSNSLEVSRARKKFYAPANNWIQQKCKIIYKDIGSFSEALLKEKDAIIMSSTENEEYGDTITIPTDEDLDLNFQMHIENNLFYQDSANSRINQNLQSLSDQPTKLISIKDQNDPIKTMQKDIEDIKNQIVKLSDLLEMKLAPVEIGISTLLNKLSNNTIGRTLEEDTSIDLNLPISTIQELEECENSIRNSQELKNKMVKLLSYCGGIDGKKNIRNIMKKFISDEVLLQFSWGGTKSKKNFSAFNQIVSIISMAVRSRHPLFTEQETVDYLKEYIKHSKTRCERSK